MPLRTFLPLEEQTCFKVVMHMHIHFDSLFETVIKSGCRICITDASNSLMRCTKSDIFGISLSRNFSVSLYLSHCFITLEMNIKAGRENKVLWVVFIAAALRHREPVFLLPVPL